jgi:hypothetical protein
MIGDPMYCNECGRDGKVFYSEVLTINGYSCRVESGICRWHRGLETRKRKQRQAAKAARKEKPCDPK